MKAFAADVVKELFPGSQKSDGDAVVKHLHVAAVTVADEAAVAFRTDVTGSATRSVATKRLLAMDYAGGNGVLTDTNLHLGLGQARTLLSEFANEASVDPGVTNVLVSLTDGLARNTKGADATALLKSELSDYAPVFQLAERWVFNTGSCPDDAVLALLAPGQGRSRVLATAAASDFAADVLSTTVPCSSQCMYKQADVVFILDRSSSQSSAGVCDAADHSIEMVLTMMKGFDADAGLNGIRMAAVTFAEYADVAFDFETSTFARSSNAYLAEKLSKAKSMDLSPPPTNGPTLLQNGFKTLRANLLQPEAGFRNYAVPLILIVLTGDSVEHPHGAVSSVLDRLQADADNAGGVLERYVVDVHQPLNRNFLDGIPLAARPELIEQLDQQEEQHRRMLAEITGGDPSRVFQSACSGSAAEPAVAAVAKAISETVDILPAAIEECLAAIAPPQPPTTTSTVAPPTTATVAASTDTVEHCNGVEDPEDCGVFVVSDCIHPIYGFAVFQHCRVLCPGSCIPDAPAVTTRKPPLTTTEVPTTTTTTTATTTTAATTTTNTVTTSTTPRTTLSTTTTESPCTVEQGDVVFLVERSSRKVFAGNSGGCPQATSSDSWTRQQLAGFAARFDGNTISVGVVIYGGGLADAVFNFGTVAEFANQINNLHLLSPSTGHPGLLDKAFATARETFVEGIFTTTPDAFVLITQGSAFESTSGALAAEIDRINRSASADAARMVVALGNAHENSGGGSSDGGTLNPLSSFSGSGSVPIDPASFELLAQLNKEFRDQQLEFLLQVVSLDDNAAAGHVYEAQCTEVIAIDDADFSAELRRALSIRCDETTTSSSTTSSQEPCKDADSCRILQEVICGTNAVDRDCNVVVLAPKLCETQSVKEECPAMCGACAVLSPHRN